MKITLLCGGPSSEREVSLRSGAAVAQGLREAGHDVFVSDINATDLSGLDRPCDVVFPVLHGQFGESGELQEILEQRGLPFVGSGSAASRLGMDKVATKRAWEKVGLPTPPYRVITRADGNQPPIPGSCVVKAIDGGSSIDVFVCKAPPESEPKGVSTAIDTIVGKYGQALVEKFIDGFELTVGILEDRALSPILIEVSKTHEFFDYTAKYVGNDAKHNFDVGLPKDLVKHIQDLALKAFHTVGCRDLSRVDVMIDRHTLKPYLLEINTMPGFTSKSLLPEMAGHEGISFSKLVDLLARRARDRHPNLKSSAA